MEETKLPEQPEEATHRQRKRRSRFLEAFETIAIAFLLAIFIRSTVAEARYIPSESMLPTLQIGDRLIIEKVSSYFTLPRRGDILVFYPPYRQSDEMSRWQKTMRWLGFTTEIAYIKRVIGLPGEVIEVKEGKVFINGKPLTEKYIESPPFYTYPPYKVPEDSFFMLGDNRNNSQDSHKWGSMPIHNIIGKAVIRFWPVNRLGLAD